MPRKWTCCSSLAEAKETGPSGKRNLEPKACQVCCTADSHIVGHMRSGRMQASEQRGVLNRTVLGVHAAGPAVAQVWVPRPLLHYAATIADAANRQIQRGSKESWLPPVVQSVTWQTGAPEVLGCHVHIEGRRALSFKAVLGGCFKPSTWRWSCASTVSRWKRIWRGKLDGCATKVHLRSSRLESRVVH